MVCWSTESSTAATPVDVAEPPERIQRLADDTLLQRLWRAQATELTRFATLLVGPHDAVDAVAAAFAKLLDRDVGEIANPRAYL